MIFIAAQKPPGGKIPAGNGDEINIQILLTLGASQLGTGTRSRRGGKRVAIVPGGLTAEAAERGAAEF